MARNSPLPGHANRAFTIGAEDEQMRRMSSSARWTKLAAVLAVIAPLACKKENRAAGEVSRNWMPVQQQQYMGVSAADVQAAIKTRLAAAPPQPVSADEWKHV